MNFPAFRLCSILLCLVLFSCSRQPDPVKIEQVQVKPEVPPPSLPVEKPIPEAVPVAPIAPIVLKSPATMAEVVGAIDLRQLPKLPGARIQMAQPIQLIYTAPGSLSDVGTLYRNTLTGLGWKEDKTPFPSLDPTQDFFSEFDKAGFRLTVSASPDFMNKELLRVQLSNHGNVDPRRFPQMDDAKPQFDRWHFMSYKTAATPEKVIDFYRKEITGRGWKEYRVSGAKFHAKEGRHLLGFVQNAMDLFMNIKAEKEGPTVVEFSVKVRAKSPTIPLANPPSAITFAEGKRLIDLNRFPRIEGAGPGKGSSAELVYEAPGTVQDAVIFYRQKLHALGWSEDDPLAEPDNFPRLEFTKEGSYLTCSVRKNPEKDKVYIHVTHAGNVDCRTLPRLDDAAEGDSEGVDDVRYETETPINKSSEFFLKELPPLGWKEFKYDNKDYPDGSKLLVFLQNAVELKVHLRNDSVRLQSHLFGDFIPTPAEVDRAFYLIDLKKMPRLKGITLKEESSSSLEFTSPQTITEVAGYYRKELLKRGWSQQATSTRETAQEAGFRYLKDGFFLTVSIQAKEGAEVTVAVHNRGNIDSRKLLHPEDAELDLSSWPENTRYTTGLSVEETIDFYRKELPKFGWKASTDGEMPGKVLVFTQKSGRLVVALEKAADGSAVQLTTWVIAKK